jgi:hypothetical protein
VTTRDELQTALDRLDEGTDFCDPEVDPVIAAARFRLRLLPLNGQWDEAIVDKGIQALATLIAAQSLDWDLEQLDWNQAVIAVLSALTEED